MCYFVAFFSLLPDGLKPQSDRKIFKSSTMNVIQWYAISLAGALAAIFICQAGLYASSLYAFVLFYFSKYIASPLLLQRRY
jgi:hypothetical protein